MHGEAGTTISCVYMYCWFRPVFWPGVWSMALVLWLPFIRPLVDGLCRDGPVGTHKQYQHISKMSHPHIDGARLKHRTR